MRDPGCQHKNLITLRKNHRLSQKKLAKILGFSYEYISRIERGKSDGSLEFWNAICTYFNFTKEQIWDIANDEYPIDQLPMQDRYII